TDVNGNSSSCSANVTVQDNVVPTALCQNLTVQLNAGGSAGATAAQVDNSSFDNCGIASMSLSPTAFTCANVGSNAVTLTVTDVNGNSASCSATVTVQDNSMPTAACQNVTVQLDASGSASVTTAQVNNSSSDNCGIAGLSVSPSLFTCANIGPNAVTLTVTDVNGNSGSCAATVTVQDNVAPTALCQNVTVQLNASGNGSTTATAVNNGSSDACGIASMSLSPTAFTCANVGSNTVTLTVTDVNGNSSTCSANVTVQENIPPTALCQNVTVQLNASGSASVTATQVNNSSTDNCSISSMSVAPNTFGCIDEGENAVTLTVTDGSGNSSTCSATVTVEDNQLPVAVCQNVTVQLDASGYGSTTAAEVGSGSTDACGIQSAVLSEQSFDCADVGANPVTLTVTDVNGNSSSCSATVTVQDNIAPTALCQNVTIQLDASGEASVKIADIDGGSTDACGIETAALGQQYFYCPNLGTNAISLTVTDANGNSSSCGAIVTVEDQIAPVAVCKNTTVYLSPEGTYTLDESEVLDFDNSYDNCGFTVTGIMPATFGCEDAGAAQSVMVSIEDAAGNFASCNATVTVEIGTGLPEPWIGTDIGSQGGGSSYDYNPCAGETGAFTITTGANNSLPTMDNLGFINRQLCGDFTITVRIENVTPTGYAGIVIREDNTPGSRMIGEYSNHSTLLRWEARLVANGPKTFNFFNAPLPYWLRLQRAGNWFLGYYSFDGVNFYLVSAQNMPMAPCVRAGMGAYTNITGTPVTAVFTNVSVQGGIIPLLSAPAVEIPQAAVGKEALNVSLYPNPARDVVTLALSRTADPGQSGQVLPGGVAHSLSPGKSSEVRVRLLNQQGQLVEERQLEGLGQAYEWDIHSLPAGLYFMEVQLEGELPQMVRFIKAN
ncbi:MAG: hypothetical protein KDC66_24000, partial [Phaeodactylibacter sp.]|nr:hypothetical protein [Phaeodactylibacter sp.]